jgi:hypothetical protein
MGESNCEKVILRRITTGCLTLVRSFFGPGDFAELQERAARIYALPFDSRYEHHL